MAQDNQEWWMEEVYKIEKEYGSSFASTPMIKLLGKVSQKSREEGYNEAITHKQYEGRCESCNLNKVSHYGTKELCCICHVSQGNIPSDWHSNCMLAYKIREDALKESSNK